MPKKPKLNYAATPGKVHPKDCFQTPDYAIEPLLPYISKDMLIWESACGKGYIVNFFGSRGYKILGTDLENGYDFFSSNMLHDVQITNPPFSLKYPWFKRSCELGTAFALLMPIDVIGTVAGQYLMKWYNIEVLLLGGQRVDYATPNRGFENSNAEFSSAWFTRGLNLGQQLVFSTMNKPSKRGYAKTTVS